MARIGEDAIGAPGPRACHIDRRIHIERRTAFVTDFRHFRALSRNWEALAQTDPLFGVLSDPAKSGGQWDAAEFFASGDAHVREVLRTLDVHGVTLRTGACLDFGCGVGRLTKPWSERFDRTVGVDVSLSMVRAARKHQRPPHHAEFLHNRHPDLRLFDAETFDFVHSCLVLQHIPPEISLRYIREFFRVAKPGGIVLFQLPAERISEDVITARCILPEGSHLAGLEIVSAPEQLETGARGTIRVRVTNKGHAAWPHDLPLERAICLGNHWLHADGSMFEHDDGRGRLPVRLAPGESIDSDLAIKAPSIPGEYEIEIDLLQENVCWFAQKGSITARRRIGIVPSTRPPAAPPKPPSLWQRLRRRVQRGTPTFEMHVVPRAAVEQVIAESGGVLLHAIDDGAASARWLSYTYVCRKR